MRYVLLIYNDLARFDWYARLTPVEVDDDMRRIVDWFGAQPEGRIVGGEELSERPLIRTVRRRMGETHVTDGPFAETKEMLGGFVVVEAADIDEAAGIAAGWPGLTTADGTTFEHDRIEVRPIAKR